MKRRAFARSAALGTAGLTLGAAKPGAAARTPEPVKPRRLRAGSRVALVNPAGATFDGQDIEIVEERLAALGLVPIRGRHLLDRHGYLAGTDEARAADLNEMFADDTVDGVLAVRGGWGAARLLHLLDFDAVAANPKVFLGYSDITTLLLALHARTGLVTFHGPVGTSEWNDFSVGALRAVVFEGTAPTLRNPVERGSDLAVTEDRPRVITPGRARGRLLGGNLTVLASILGSPYVPDWSGSILFLEDVGEAVYRIDRLLTQLALAGVLDSVAGVVFGKCTDCDPDSAYGSLTLPEVLEHHLGGLDVPVWAGGMVGHIPRKWTLPVGVEAEIDTASATVRLLEPAVV
ncbi:MAG: LD-carboxypeptidase [Gemmatimonadota bacterium]